MNAKVLIFIFFLLFAKLSSQIEIVESNYASLYTDEQNKIYSLWKNYLKSWNNNKNEKCLFWKNDDYCDLLSTEGFFNPSLYELGFSNQVIDISRIDNKSYNISSLFYWIGENKDLNTMAITNVIAERQADNSFLLSNFLTNNGEKFLIYKQEDIIYHYPQDFFFYKQNAKSAVIFLKKLRLLFNLPQKTVNYYIFKNCQDVFKNKGFYFAPGMSRNENCAFFDSHNNIIYTTQNYGEAHYHELIHSINEKYPNAHYLLLSGLAIYHNDDNVLFLNNYNDLFMSLNRYILHNNIKSIDIFNFPTFDSSITGDYMSGAILIDVILQNGGIELLKEALKEIKTDDDVNNFINKKLKLSSKEYNDLSLKKIKEMSNLDFKTKLF